MLERLFVTFAEARRMKEETLLRRRRSEALLIFAFSTLAPPVWEDKP